MGRKRIRLVPRDGVECFEVRIALYLTPEGDFQIGYEISDPDDPNVYPPLHEVLGVLEFAKAFIVEENGKEYRNDDHR